MTVAIIMARGGSKRIPRKNVRPFLGLPMVAWPVRHARESGLFSEIVISTDDPEIASAAEAEGARFYGLRPESVANDFANTADVLRYELQQVELRDGQMPEVCCCLYGTSAMALPQLLREGKVMLDMPGTEAVYAVLPYPHPIERSLAIGADGVMQYRYPEFVNCRSQDLPVTYHDSGLFYWLRTDAFWATGGIGFTPLKKRGVVVSTRDAVDIDTEDDWIAAEKIGMRILLSDVCE